MSSILKVDQLQDSGGNEIITSNGSGTITVNSQTFKNGITEVDQWRLTANLTSNTDPISANLERNDSTGFGYIGTGMSVSSGTWTFPSTGIWLIRAKMNCEAVSNDNVVLRTRITTDNSTYVTVAEANDSGDGSVTGAGGVMSEFLFDCTDTSTHKVQFSSTSIGSGSYIIGTSSYNTTSFTFVRLGDT